MDDIIVLLEILIQLNQGHLLPEDTLEVLEEKISITIANVLDPDFRELLDDMISLMNINSNGRIQLRSLDIHDQDPFITD